MDCAWKKNWEETKRNFTDWWNKEGLVISQWGGIPTGEPHEVVENPGRIERNQEEYYSDSDFRARRNHYRLANRSYPSDIMPVANTSMGPGSLALALGSRPEFRNETVWFHPTIHEAENPETLGSLKFNPQNKWWRVQEKILAKTMEFGRGSYMAGCPDLIENIDVLAMLRGQQKLFVDMIERPEWVSQSLSEINQAFFEAYDRIYDIINLEDGSAVYEAFHLWGPGKTAKVQCDNATMFSPDMFRKYVVPALKEQCEWLDYSMYHLDGMEEFVHLDALLEIEALDAIEWTPNATEPLGGDPKWFDLYRRILDAGKSVQVYFVLPQQVVPVLDAIGGKGVYILGIYPTEAELEKIMKDVEQFR